MSTLDDGVYEVIVVDARRDDEDVVHLDLAVINGAHRGELITLAARHLHRADVDLLATFATLTVHDGEPALSWS